MQLETKYKNILDKMLEGIQIIGRDFRYLYVNEVVARHGKSTPKELIGFTMMEKYPGIENTEVFKCIGKCLTDRTPSHIENEFVYPDGSTGWFELSIQPVEEGVLILSIDITQRKKVDDIIRKAKANYEQLFDNCNDGIYVYDFLKKQITEVNQRVCEMTGFTRGELMESPYGKLISNKTGEFLSGDLGLFFKNAASGEPQRFEWKIANKKGTTDWVEISLKRITIDGGDKILVSLHEINERKKNQESILQLNEKLEEKVEERTTQLLTVNKELEAFSYSVSHDLRSPLRALHGYSKMIEEDYGKNLDEEAHRLLGNIQYYSQKMGRLIDDLLDFSRMGRKELQKKSFDMNGLVKDAINEITVSYPNKASIKVAKLPSVIADHTLIYQAWLNLISNAVKYSSKKEHPKVEIGSQKNPNEIIYFIKDNGTGFDMKYAHRLFGVFQRLHTPEDFEGTGIGLAIVQRIISKHEGRIWVEAAPDAGATFYFSLPHPNSDKL